VLLKTFVEFLEKKLLLPHALVRLLQVLVRLLQVLVRLLQVLVRLLQVLVRLLQVLVEHLQELLPAVARHFCPETEKKLDNCVKQKYRRC